MHSLAREVGDERINEVAGSEKLKLGTKPKSRGFGLLTENCKELDDGWPESEKGKDVDVKYIEERRCEKISEERMNI